MPVPVFKVICIIHIIFYTISLSNVFKVFILFSPEELGIASSLCFRRIYSSHLFFLAIYIFSSVLAVKDYNFICHVKG